MRTMLFSLAAGTVLLGGLAVAEAMPGHPASTDAPAGSVTLVSGGCGFGSHRGVYGGCRPNFYRGPGYRHFGYRRYGSQRYFYHNF